MAYGQASGTTNYVPFESDLLLDALERAEIYAPEQKHMFSARRSSSLLLASKWSNKGINLWRIDRQPTVIPLIQGVKSYDLTSDIIAMFDTYRRQYAMNAPVSAAPNFSTVLGSNIVTIGGIASAVGNYIGLSVHVSVGGIVLYGFYQVVSTPTAVSVTVKAATNATATVNNAGATAIFTTTAHSALVNVNLPAHGLLPGQPFVVGVATPAGGIVIFGSYTVTAVVDANNFTIQAASLAISNAVVSENAGQSLIATQNAGVAPQDIFMSPISRTDYAGQANKDAPGPPSTYWYSKEIIPLLTVWPVTDANGPYELRSYMMRQIQDFAAANGSTPNLPNRMWYAFVSDLAADLAMKFNAKKYEMLRAVADDAWDDASATDVENVSLFVVPNLPSGL